MKAALALTALLALTGTTVAQDGPRDLLVRAGKVWVGNGQVLEKVRILIKNGKIDRITKDEGDLPDGVAVQDLRRRTLIPGMIAAHTDLAATDQVRNLTPDVVAADQFDFFRKWPQLVRTGLTAVYLSPGRSRLMPGQGSVVKLAGRDSETRLLKEASALRVQISPTARRNVPAVFEPTVSPTADDPLLPARRQRGSTRSSQLDVLARAFAEARDPDRERGGEGKQLYWLAPLRAALGGTLKVRLAAQTAADALYGLDLLSELGIAAVLERPTQVLPLRDRLAGDNTPCIVQIPMRPGQPNPGDLQPGDERKPRLTPEVAGRLAEAGVAVAVVPASDSDLDKLRMLAGLSCRWGLSPEKALAAITLEAARILGVDDRVGSIEEGKDADFVVLSGDPFDARSQIEHVFVDGESVWKRKVSQATFAIRAGRVMVGDGTEHRDAAVVVRGSKIVYVGPDTALPPGAEIIDASDAVLVPGFIAAASKLGLHSDATGTARFPATTDVDVAGALESDDPVFRPALEAGITTLFVTPDDSGLVGGRVCAVKTHGDGEGFVVRDVTGLRMTLSAGGAAGKKQLLAVIKKAKDYINPPKKKEVKKKPEPKKEVPKKPVDVISGSWKGTVSGGPLPQPMSFTAEMTLSDKTKVEATLTISAMPIPVKFTGTFENNFLKLEGNAPPPIGALKCEGKYESGKITGTITGSQGALSFTMERTQAAEEGEGETAAPPKEEKKPKKDEKLEPWRPVLDGKAALVVRAANAEAALAAMEAIAKESKLKLVLAGNARDVIRKKIRPPQDTSVGFILGCNEVLFEQKGKAQNVAQDLADLGYRVVLVSRAQLGTRYLPVHAAWAVATGFDPRRALSSISGAPAQCFGLGDRVGRLAEGCDADLVLLSGDPFDLTTRVRAVWVNGIQRLNRMEGNKKKESR
jgi:imidazolonepropionase-like amidohydrolase